MITAVREPCIFSYFLPPVGDPAIVVQNKHGSWNHFFKQYFQCTDFSLCIIQIQMHESYFFRTIYGQRLWNHAFGNDNIIQSAEPFLNLFKQSGPCSGM